MKRTKVRPRPVAIGKGLGKSGRAGQRTETQSKPHQKNRHNGEPPRLRDGRYMQEFTFHDILHFPFEVLAHPAILRMVMRAESGECDCILCGVPLDVGRLSLVCIGPKQNGQALACGCCAKCLCSLGIEAAGRAIGQVLDECYGGGGPLDVHVGTESVQ